jgi:hypothetical protein
MGPRIVGGQDVAIGVAVAGPAQGADLAHADAVAPALPVDHVSSVTSPFPWGCR